MWREQRLEERLNPHPHLSIEAQAHTHLPHLPIPLRGVQVAAETGQGDGGPTVRQKHVGWSGCDDGVGHWAWEHTHTHRKWNGPSGTGEAGPQAYTFSSELMRSADL